jgi:DNA polymerase II large subunit
MDIDDYFNRLSEEFHKAYDQARLARAKGIDPKTTVEIRPAPDLASRVEGLTGIEGIGELIRSKSTGQSRSRLAFDVVKEICTNDRFETNSKYDRIGVAVKVGTAILTEGILVAPTEGIQGVKAYRNQDGSDYIAVVYAGPIRGAGGTAAALSVALADYARKFFGVGQYRPTMDEVERYVEEIELYHTRAARLQYRPGDDDIRVIVGNCPVCVDGVPTEQIDVGVHSNMKKTDINGKEIAVPNKVRGGIALVVCEGIAQKAKKLVKEVRGVGMDWDWLNGVIKVDVKKTDTAKNTSVFLEDLAAGRPILAYPGALGGFRLRYGRSRFTGIAAKGFNPATMLLTKGFIATGTQLKVELPGKGCVAMPVDSIEGPFVRLKSGEALRINDAEIAARLKDEIDEILYMGDILVTYGDFRKSNTLLQPTSFVEELWRAQVAEAHGVDISEVKEPETFIDAYEIAFKTNVGIHPKYLFEFQAVSPAQLGELALGIQGSSDGWPEKLSEVDGIRLANTGSVKRILERMCVPHRIDNGVISIDRDNAHALIASLGFVKGPEAFVDITANHSAEYAGDEQSTLQIMRRIAPIAIPKRSTFIGARIGRPEKARERLMKPAPNVLFPIGAYGGPARNISSAYAIDSKKFRSGLRMEVARYRCPECKLIKETRYCRDCGRRCEIEYKCPACGRLSLMQKCEFCKTDTVAYEEREINLVKMVTDALQVAGVSKLPAMLKGVRGLTNRERIAEPLEKGVLRAAHNVHMFKDGTSRFDSTDAPLTHFYPYEAGVSIDKLRAMGYDTDYRGEPLTNEDQLVELRHQDIIMNRKGGDDMLRISQFVDDILDRLYGLPRFYNAVTIQDMIGKLVISLSPHTSCGVLNRVVGFTQANVGFAHPYTISARRRNCDGDEDTVMLLLDALINFSRTYLPESVGGTMDTPLILTLNVKPEEVDDEVHAMETVERYPLQFYAKTYEYASPAEAGIELVEGRLKDRSVYSDIMFTHGSSKMAVEAAPKRSLYAELNTMQEKVDAEFGLMDKIAAVDKRDAAKRVITSHFIPDLIGNMHSFSRQTFRCSSCNAKYRRVPLSGKCVRDGGKLLLTISKGGIEKYLEMAIGLAERYSLEPYIRQRLYLVRDEINEIFTGKGIDANATEGQFSLMKYF